MEESETINEELKSTNEELQSTNEELQSSNEELETAKEEMQSLNEELQTVNSELQQKVDDLSQTNDDMTNLLNSTDIATLFLDFQLHIKRFTPQLSNVIKLIDTDVGRPISELVMNLDYRDLETDAQEVLRTLAYREVAIPTYDGRWYLMRMMPYRTAQNVIDGLVITFVDITQQKQAEVSGLEAQTYAQSVIDMIHEGVVMLDAEMQVVSANRAFCRLFGQTEGALMGHSFFSLDHNPWDHAELTPLFERVLTSGEPLEALQLVHPFPQVGEVTVWLNARRIEVAAQARVLVVLTVENLRREG